MSMNQTDALARIHQGEIINLDPDDTKRKLAAIAAFQGIIRHELKENLDFGVIPGTNKPTLLKPGAEKLAKLLNCYDEYEIVERIEDWSKPLFRYLVRCTLIEMVTGTKVSSGLGECNSYESKYRYRWVEEGNLPVGVRKEDCKSRGGKKTVFEFDFAIEKREIGGKYGKTAEYWDVFEKAVRDGVARKSEKSTKSGKVYPGHEMDVDTTQYQVSNPDIYDQVNTILKMAKKRALVDAALSAGRLSDLFTQDLEDFAEYEPAPATVPPAEAKRQDKPAEEARPKAEAKPKTEDHGFPKDEAGEDGPITDDQVASISRHIKTLRDLGKTETQVWQEIYRKAKDKGPEVAELPDMSFAQADYVDVYLGQWIEHVKAERSKKSGKGA